MPRLMRFRLDGTDPDREIENLRRALHEQPANVCILELYYPQSELTLAEAGERLGCSYNQLKRLIADNELAATQRPHSRQWLIPEESIVEYEARRARFQRDRTLRENAASS